MVAQGVNTMNRSRHVTRRNALQLGAAAAALPLVHIRTAGAAGKLTVGFWDHWVPPANDAMKKQVTAWADKNKVDVTIDFITSNGNKIEITQAAEAQARTGHDLLPFYNWEVNTYAEQLEPIKRFYLADQVVTPDGALHKFVNVYLNDDDIRYLDKLDTKIAEGDTVSILPAVAGGA